MTLLSVLLSATAAFSQKSFTHFGIEGGISINRFSDFKDLGDNGPAGWHAGISLLTKLPGFFGLQPTVVYERSHPSVVMENGETSVLNVDAIDVPVSVQWGPDLGICRIFLEAVPFVEFNLGARYKSGDTWTDVKDYLKTTQFGLGAGAGLDIWRFQFNFRYNWSFGDWHTMTASNPFKDLHGKKKGIMLTLAYFFN